VPLVDDKAGTFSRPQRVASTAFAKKVMPPLEKQTVGAVAQQFITFYMGPANYSYGIKGTDGNDGFDAYWAARKDRQFCASWFAVQLARASQRTTPTPRERFDKIRAVRQRIDKLTRADRPGRSCGYAGDGQRRAVNEAELVAACKELARNVWFGCSSARFPATTRMCNREVEQRPLQEHDPVRPRARGNAPASQGRRYTACLRGWERDHVNTASPTHVDRLVTIAAAELRNDKDKAKDLLVKAFDYFQDGYQDNERAQLAIALWRWWVPTPPYSW